MTTVPMTTKPSNSSFGDFRGWGSPISNAMATIGWTKISTNIDWTTILAPTTTYQVMGYEIWAMADTLQATHPVYVKIEYGSSNDKAQVSIWITIGTNHNGSDTLTGQVSERKLIALTQGLGTSPIICYFSGSPSRVTMALWQFSTYYFKIHINIERSLDASANVTNQGVAFHAYNPTGVCWCQFIPFEGVIFAAANMFNCVVMPAGSGVVGSNIYLAPIRCFNPNESFPILGFAAYVNADITQNQQISITDWGGHAHNYIAIGAINTQVNYGLTPVSSVGMVALYE